MRQKLMMCVLVLAALAMSVCGQKTAEEWHDAGLALMYQGNYTEAIRCYDEAIRLGYEGTPSWY